MGKSKGGNTAKTKVGKSLTDRAEANALEEAMQDVDSRQSAADEHDAVGDDDVTPGEESDGGGKDSGKKIANPKHIATTRSAIASDGAAPVAVLLKRVEKRTQERDEAMKSLEKLKRKVADLESAAKVHYFNFCNFSAVSDTISYIRRLHRSLNRRLPSAQALSLAQAQARIRISAGNEQLGPSMKCVMVHLLVPYRQSHRS
jgi:hypothetical protein